MAIGENGWAAHHHFPPRVCRFLKKHYEEMKDDPERLTTDFIKKIIRTEEECDIPDESPRLDE